MKGLYSSIPLAVLAATARAHVQVIRDSGGADIGKDHHHKRTGGTVIGGPSGVDIGNSADIPTTNTYYSSVNQEYTDNHSVDVDKTTIIKGHKRRGDNFPEVPVSPTVIGGPSGADIGNTVNIPTVNEASTSVTETYTDNHSVDVQKNTIVKPYYEEHRAMGFHHPMHQARNNPAVIGGPNGVDSGNMAEIPTVNSVSSTFDGSYTDDHSVNIDKTFVVKPHKRAYRPGGEDTTVIGGPSGVDIGNEFSAPTVNSYDIETNEDVNDDHSVKTNSDEVITPGEPHYEGHGEQEPSQPAVDETPEPPAPAESEEPEELEEPECTKVHEVVQTVTSTRIRYQTETAVAYPQELHSEEESPNDSPDAETSFGGSSEDESEAPEDPEDTEHSDENDNSQTPSGSVSNSSNDESSNEYPSTPSSSSSDSSNDESSNESPPEHSNNSPSTTLQTPSDSGSDESSNEYPSTNSQTPSSSVSDGSNDESSNEYPSINSQTPSSSGSDRSNYESSNESSNESPSTNSQSPSSESNEQYPKLNQQQGSFSSPTPASEAADPYYHGSQVAQSSQASQTAAVIPIGAYHAPATSAVAQPSTFVVVPVQVPSGTPRAHGSAVVAASSTPASSSLIPNVPTGASAEQNERPSPSPEAHGIVMFTGAGRKVSPAAGVFSALAGGFVLLAFAM
ncbi:hypothetical protein BJX63DRAFT_182486 [Aspergillus granulosus]|uniref:GPI anchored protein n=1 Tax=Aspergillus granulosus TaxID=176169 RepID=A0ABR4I2V4_9EURO